MVIRKYWKLFLKICRFSVIYAARFPKSFAVELFVEIGYIVTFIIFFQVLFLNIDSVAGWGVGEILILQGIAVLNYQIVLGFAWVWGFRTLPEKIVGGDLDYMLLRPVDAQFMGTLGNYYVSSLFGMMLGAGLLVYGWVDIGLGFDFISILQATLIFLAGVIISYSIQGLITYLSFIFMKAKSLVRVSESVINNFVYQPTAVYKGVFLILFLIIFPVGLMAAVPAEILIFESNWNYVWLAMGLAILFFYLSRKFWKFMLSRYSSASS